MRNKFENSWIMKRRRDIAVRYGRREDLISTMWIASSIGLTAILVRLRYHRKRNFVASSVSSGRIYRTFFFFLFFSFLETLNENIWSKTVHDHRNTKGTVSKWNSLQKRRFQVTCGLTFQSLGTRGFMVHESRILFASWNSQGW